MRQRTVRNPSTGHEEVYHAPSRSQAASLPLTLRRLHSQSKPCPVEGQTRGCLASQESRRIRLTGMLRSGRSGSMKTLRPLKDGRLVACALATHGEEHSRPDISQCPNCDGMAFPFLALAVVIVSGPGFLMRTLPSELRQSIAQGGLHADRRWDLEYLPLS